MKYCLTILSIFLAFSCQKGLLDITPGSLAISVDCDLLKQGLAEKNISMITESLGELLKEQYSNENLNQLAADISADCDVNATLKCFDCIKTNPPQSEMNISFAIGDPVRNFVLDVAPSTDNTIKVISVE